jgi:hypothetical protein
MSLANADRSIGEVVAYFTSFGIEAGLLVPTETGLAKSIMDAHAPLRDFLKAKGVHDYGSQEQGPDAKRVIKAFFVTEAGLVETQASLYRPVTKQGDPRIWFSQLGRHARAGNVLAILGAPDALYVINASDKALLAAGRSTASTLGRLIEKLAPKVNPVATELLERLREISGRGYIPSLRNGPTGVGFTLESVLGIRANSEKTPDYKGIELKSSRVSRAGSVTTRSTLFAAVPDWKSSRITKARAILDEYGYVSEEGRRQLYCSLSDKPNSQGFFLQVDTPDDTLHAMNQRSGAADADRVVQWAMPRLRTALRAKHRETFWVKARTLNLFSRSTSSGTIWRGERSRYSGELGLFAIGSGLTC